MPDLDSNVHLKAIQAELAGLGYPVSVGFAETSRQYVVLTAPAWGQPEEQRLATGDLALDVDVRVKAVTGTVDGVSIMLRDVRAILSPWLLPHRIPLEGWETWIRWQRSEVLDVDESTTITGTSRHPAFGVETYRLTSEPTS